MDLSAVNWNVTIDDFDSILTYEDQSVWTTPDPSVPNFDPTNSPWLRGTFHQTTTKGASVSLNITGESFVFLRILHRAHPSFTRTQDLLSTSTGAQGQLLGHTRLKSTPLSCATAHIAKHPKMFRLCYSPPQI